MKLILKNFLAVVANFLLNFKRSLSTILMLHCLHSAAQENTFKKITGSKNFKIHTITQDDYNNIWLATNKGLVKYDGIALKNYDFKIGNSSQEVQTLFSKNDSLFIGKNKSINLKTKDTLLTFESKSVQKIVEHNNQYYFATNQGVWHFRGDYLQPLKTKYNLDFSLINDILFYDNSFIVASNSGLWKLDALIKPKKITKLSSGEFSSLLKIENKLFVLKNKNEILEVKEDHKLDLKYILNEINTIKNIDDKIYVISKNNGIDVLNATTFIFEKRLNKYNSNLNSNTIYTAFQDSEKNVFIASNTGLYLKKNTSITAYTKLQIADISINYTPLNKSIQTNSNNALQLNRDQNNIAFLLQSISICNPKSIVYRHQLNNGEFSPWSTQNQINFANLESGKYTFIAQSKFINSNKITSEKFHFSIDKPIYKKVWFITLCIVLFCLVAASLLEIYIRKLKKKNEQKVTALKLENHLLSLEQKALQLQMNPHFIFNVLNGIKALGNTNNKKELNSTISQFAVLLRSVLNNSNLAEISLKEEINTLKNYLFLEQKMNTNAFEFSITENLNSIDAEEILIPPMLIQPFVENAVKHGISKIQKKGEIEISFKVNHRFLECCITDNGIGIYESQKNKSHKSHNSLALKITKERIKNLNKYANFTIKELKNKTEVKGTSIQFKIPLKTDF
ncbi:histidine kinase [uncultured Polaribacter sp.]|uniref:sensor histidine kinase n=1 Tax=uncultured Polaribacter sp. TaxID=174711 RepID=UPI0026372B03|nr:histidine kinase [uncultured Polaribacter sp.]